MQMLKLSAAIIRKMAVADGNGSQVMEDHGHPVL